MQQLQIVKRYTFQLISLVVISLYMAGCSLFGPRIQSIGVSSDPPGAEVIASGKSVGITPLRFEVQRGDTLVVEVRKSGYQTQFRTFSRKLNNLGLVDVIGGAIILLPLIGLISPAAWDHDPDQLGVALEPEQKVPPTK
jgi:PEGA domain